MATSRYTLHPRRHWTSGAAVCLALFAFGGLLLWGLFRAPRAKAPTSPDVPWGVPQRAVRVVCLDAGQWARTMEELPQRVAPLDPDFVLVQRIPGRAVVPLAEALGMQRSYHPANFARGGDDDAGGCLILSKHPLYDATPLRPDVRRPVAAGVWATTVVDNRRFATASADAGPRLREQGVPSFVAAALLDGRQTVVGNPPLIAGLRAPQMLSARAELLQTARLTSAEEPTAANGEDPGPDQIVGFAGPWRVIGIPKEVAPGIHLVEVGPQ